MKTLIAASMLGLAAGHFGTGATDPHTQLSFGANDATQVVSQENAIPESSAQPTTRLHLPMAGTRAPGVDEAIARDVDEAATNIEAALAETPALSAAMGRSINEHGVVRALLYEDPQVKEASDKMGGFLGRGLRALGDAISKDMVDGARHLHSSES